MADGLLQVVLDNLNALILNEYRLLSSFEEQNKKMSSTLTTIRAVIKDAEEREVTEEAVRNWLKKHKDAAYDVNDLLDESATKALQAQVDSGIGCCNMQVRCSYLPLSCFEQVTFRHNIGIKQKKIGKRLDEIAAEKSNFYLTAVTRTAERQQTDSISAEPQVYGREGDLEKIVVSLVTETSDREGVSIHAIIGMGVLGKTTLAKLAYNDDRVNTHFELKIWVCVSEDFDEPRLVKAITESISGNECDLKELDPMKRRLQEKLSGKRFLPVLDDDWNEEQEKWDSLKSLLTCGADGSKIIVTTRMENVVWTMGAISRHPMAGLSEEDCWSLFKKRAFGVEPEEEHQNLVAIGKEIVRKCAGVPLAAKALGSLMRLKRDESYWLFVKDSEIWDLKDNKQILPALRLSYNHLPSHLKPCFAYCSIFPKDYEFEKEILILLWMANGFLSLICESNSLSSITEALYEAKTLRTFILQFPNYGRRADIKKVPDYIFTHCRCLRVLDLSRSTITKLSNSLGNLIHLRYLKLSHTKIKTLPESTSSLQNLQTLILSNCSHLLQLPNDINKLSSLRYLDINRCCSLTHIPESMANLRNLQTLILRYCYELCKLPKDINKMSSLRYLDIAGCNKLTHMPAMIGQLSCLKALTVFIVGKESGWRIQELQGLNLRGELHIKNLNNVSNKEGCFGSKFVEKRKSPLVGSILEARWWLF